MSVGLMLITHQQLGQTLIEQVEALLGPFSADIAVLNIRPQDDPTQALARARQELARVDRGDGVLVLTDVYGATPSNIAHRLGPRHRHVIVHGLNLAMLMRAHNYADDPLQELSDKVLEGGHRSIFAGDP